MLCNIDFKSDILLTCNTYVKANVAHSVPVCFLVSQHHSRPLLFLISLQEVRLYSDAGLSAHTVAGRIQEVL